MGRSESRGAGRHDVSWPARVRCADDMQWHTGEVRNLSVTGVLLRTDRMYRVGDRVEVEIDFLTQPDRNTVVAGIGLIVRTDTRSPGHTAVQFVEECGLSTRNDSDIHARPA